MEIQLTSPDFLWRSFGQPAGAWFLLGLPPVLTALGGDPSLGAAMAHLLAVLLVAALIWARGLGASGTWQERLFLGVWAAAWAGALGGAATGGSWPASNGGTLLLFAALLIGAGWLGWASHERLQLRLALARTPATDRTPSPPPARLPSTTTLVLVWVAAALVFGLALSAQRVHWGDGVAGLFALGLFTTFQRGRLQPPAEPPSPVN